MMTVSSFVRLVPIFARPAAIHYQVRLSYYTTILEDPKATVVDNLTDRLLEESAG